MYRIVLIFVGIMLLAFNGRIAATAVGPVLPQLANDLGMSTSVQGLLTTLPVAWFAVSSAFAPLVMRRVGLRWSGFITISLCAVGQAGRLSSTQTWEFLFWSSLALLGMGIGNVVMPSLVKRYFDTRLGLVTAAYSTTMSVGILGTSVLTVPLANWGGSWTFGLGVWAAVALAAVPVWLLIAARRGTGQHAPKQKTGPRITFAQVARTKMGRIIAVFFSVQTSMAYGVLGWLPSIYQGAGFTPVEAGNYMGLFAALGIGVSFGVPALAGRLRSPVAMMVFVGLSGVAGFVGLLVAPTVVPWLWAALLAFGNGGFPLFLFLLGSRAETATGTAALSAFTQSFGYLLGIPGPFLVGVLLGFSGGWLVPLLFLTALMTATGILGVLACRPGTLEAELGLAGYRG